MFIESLEITLFGMAIVFVMLLLIILAVKVIEPVRRFFAGLFKREPRELSPKKKPGPRLQTAKCGPKHSGGSAGRWGGGVFAGRGLKRRGAEPAIERGEYSRSADGGTVAAIIAAIERLQG